MMMCHDMAKRDVDAITSARWSLFPGSEAAAAGALAAGAAAGAPASGAAAGDAESVLGDVDADGIKQGIYESGV